VVANGASISGKTSPEWDTMTAVFDTARLMIPPRLPVQDSSRFTNSAGGSRTLLLQRGMIDMDKQTVTPEGGCRPRSRGHGAQANLLPVFRSWRSGVRLQRRDTGGDPQTSPICATGWSACVRARHLMLRLSRLQPLHRAVHECRGDPTGEKVTFDDKTQQVIAGARSMRSAVFV